MPKINEVKVEVEITPVFEVKDDRYTVTENDTLWSIAIRNGIGMEKLKVINGLRTNIVKTGTKLKLK